MISRRRCWRRSAVRNMSLPEFVRRHGVWAAPIATRKARSLCWLLREAATGVRAIVFGGSEYKRTPIPRRTRSLRVETHAAPCLQVSRGECRRDRKIETATLRDFLRATRIIRPETTLAPL